jgi:hypothetical protein
LHYAPFFQSTIARKTHQQILDRKSTSRKRSIATYLNSEEFVKLFLRACHFWIQISSNSMLGFFFLFSLQGRLSSGATVAVDNILTIFN